MKTISRLIFTVTAGCFLAQALPAQPNTDFRPDSTIFLYAAADTPVGPDPVVGKTISSMNLRMKESNGLSGEEAISAHGGITNISDKARVDIYIPDNPSGQMVIVCPGGGYGFVSSYNEGVYIAEWMNSLGIAAAVVKYRMPDGHAAVPLEDVQNVFRYCRSNAGKWGIRQIGVMGFSAGGHLAASAATLYADKDTRPDFAVLVYPVIAMDSTPSHEGSRINLIGPDADNSVRAGWSLYTRVTPDTPQTFIAHCSDDRTVPVINSILFYNALIDNGVSAEFHIWPAGGHGWGGSSEKYVEKDKFGYARSEYETSLARWLESIGR